jgi:hypothetical protein
MAAPLNARKPLLYALPWLQNTYISFKSYCPIVILPIINLRVFLEN